MTVSACVSRKYFFARWLGATSALCFVLIVVVSALCIMIWLEAPGRSVSVPSSPDAEVLNNKVGP